MFIAKNGTQGNKRATLLNGDSGAASLVGSSHKSYWIGAHPRIRISPPPICSGTLDVFAKRGVGKVTPRGPPLDFSPYV